jgi:hypothetical protein
VEANWKGKEMTPQFQLSPNESIAVEQLLAMQTEKAKHAITLPYLTNKWSRFVTNLENGYQLTIDDYTNSLSVRDHIQEILDVCPENSSLKEWVSEWDHRFIKVTKVVKESLLPAFPNESLGWWWFRIPIKPGNEKKWLQFTKQE